MKKHKIKWPLPDNMPEDVNTEAVLLAFLCLEANDFQRCEGYLRLQDNDFVVLAHQAIFRGFKALYEENKEVTSLTLTQKLQQQGSLNLVGGTTGLIEFLNQGFTSFTYMQPLVEILQEKRRRRELMMLGARLIREPLEVTRSLKEIIDSTSEALSKIADISENRSLVKLSEHSETVMQNLQDHLEGVRTVGYKIKDWNKLNQITHGFLPGQLVILAARPGVGKTALALNWMLRVAMNGHYAAFFSLEMSSEECFKRIMADFSAIDIREMLERKDTFKFKKLKGFENTMANLPMWISDRANITVLEIKYQIDKFILQNGHKPIVFIDYLQLIPNRGANPNQSETLRIAEISRSLKILAKDAGIPIVLLSQLNREVEKRQGNKPQLSDLRDSGAIEQDADLVAFIHRDMKTSAVEADLILAKHRNGPLFTFNLQFMPGISRYEEVEKQTNPEGATQYQDSFQFDGL
jgi:replicative DNA helicase